MQALSCRPAAPRQRKVAQTRIILAPNVRTFRKFLFIAALPKDHGDGNEPTKEERPGVPSVIRRTALLGAAAPCLCALCGGGRAAKAASGRNPLYDRYFATVMRYGMEDYEAIVRPVKSQLFEELVQGLLTRDAAGGGAAAAAAAAASAAPKRVLEVGIGAGPNFPFYTSAVAQVAAAGARPAGEGEVPSGSAAAEPARQQGPAVAEPAVAGGIRLHIVGLDPNAEMLRFAGDAAKEAGMQLRGDSGASSSSSGVGGGGSNGGPAVPKGSTASVAEVSLVQGSAEALPFGDGEFDAAVVTLVMCSVPSPTTALAELRRVVRPGGRLLIIEHVAAGVSRPVLRAAQGLLTPLQRLLADGCSLNRDTAAALRDAGWQTAGQLRSFDLEGLSILAPHIAGVLMR